MTHFPPLGAAISNCGAAQDVKLGEIGETSTGSVCRHCQLRPIAGPLSRYALAVAEEKKEKPGLSRFRQSGVSAACNSRGVICHRS